MNDFGSKVLSVVRDIADGVASCQVGVVNDSEDLVQAPGWGGSGHVESDYLPFVKASGSGRYLLAMTG